tara:strand:- start:144 stop:461 length:318 start_codon:yes stop_codon:yes gene_type:complete
MILKKIRIAYFSLFVWILGSFISIAFSERDDSFEIAGYVITTDGHKISNPLFQPPSIFPTYFKGMLLCVIIEAQILTSFGRGCVWVLWFILKINNYGDVYRGCVL